jgi:hypothetical protein
MKITAEQLRRIIKEEIGRRFLREDDDVHGRQAAYYNAGQDMSDSIKSQLSNMNNLDKVMSLLEAIWMYNYDQTFKNEIVKVGTKLMEDNEIYIQSLTADAKKRGGDYESIYKSYKEYLGAVSSNLDVIKGLENMVVPK